VRRAGAVFKSFILTIFVASRAENCPVVVLPRFVALLQSSGSRRSPGENGAHEPFLTSMVARITSS
jgi:hypothetical protein